jgi:hypothetical protein
MRSLDHRCIIEPDGTSRMILDDTTKNVDERA